MWTITYKGFYIHGYCDKDNVTVKDIAGEWNKYLPFKSLHAAKCAITKWLNK